MHRFAKAMAVAGCLWIPSFGCALHRAASPALSQGGNVVTYDHSQCLASHEGEDACNATATLSLRDGDIFNIVITGTDTTRFDYTISGVKTAAPGSTQGGTALRDARSGTKTLWQKHEKQFGGYVVTIKRANTTNPEANADLGNATIRVSVHTRDWQIAFSSGFTLAGLRDPAFAITHDTLPHAANQAGGTVDTLLEEKGRRDQVARGLAAFVNVWHPSHESVGFSFGLGVDQGRGSTYYLGPAIRLGDKAMLSFGAAFGSVKTAPAGAKLNAPVKDANALDHLGQRTESAWFLGVSFPFIGGSEDALKKPFAGSTGAGGAQAGAVGSGGAPGDTDKPGNKTPQTGFTVTIDPTNIQVKADTTVTLTVTVMNGSTPVNGDTISFSGDLSSFSFSKAKTTTDATGKASTMVTVRKGGAVTVTSAKAGTNKTAAIAIKSPPP